MQKTISKIKDLKNVEILDKQLINKVKGGDDFIIHDFIIH